MMGGQRLQPFRQQLRIAQVRQAHPAPRNLVFIGRANTAPGGANFAGAAAYLSCLIHLYMHWQDKADTLRDNQIIRANRHPLCAQGFNLAQQGRRVDHHAIADNRFFALTHNTRWQQRQLVFHPVNNQRMSGIMSALKAHHHIGAFRQPIHDFAFAFITPL